MQDRQITSRDNSHYKRLKGIGSQQRNSNSQSIALLDSVHVIEACVRAGVAIRELILADGVLENPVIAKMIESVDVDVRTHITQAMFRDMTQQPSPIGVAAVIDIPEIELHKRAHQCDVMVLDSVQDSGNVGSLLRVAACSGLGTVLLGMGCAGAWSTKTVRAGQGAHFSLQIYERVNVADWLTYQALPAYGADAKAIRTIYETDLTSPCIWIFGNEGQGLSDAVRGKLSTTTSIPMASTMESLNVGAAAAVCLYEMNRQRLAIGG
jgi:RNA methyltransferase, TrmH family